jgi:hypothetical protein
VGQAYSYTQEFAYQYRFVSVGNERIEKIIIFSSTPKDNVFNFGFGDLTVDGTVDYFSNSNNGDMVRIFATIIKILENFTLKHPFSQVIFSGSTPRRTLLYRRILGTYYNSFSNEFIISALVQQDNRIKEVFFDPVGKEEYLAFLVKRI